MDKRIKAEALHILHTYGDPACYEMMVQSIVRGDATEIDAQADGVMIYNNFCGVTMLAARTTERLEQMISRIPIGKSDVVLYGSIGEEIIQRTRKHFQFCHVQRLYSYAYYGAMPEMSEALDVRPIGLDMLNFIYENYQHASMGYLRERLASGALVGAYLDEKLAAFIGEHTEGAMGFLHVMPAYRRMHLGSALENWLICRTILRGYTPYCQVFEDNTASHALQKRLGLTCSQGRIYWLTNDSF